MDERWSKHRVVTCLDWSPQVLLSFMFEPPPPPMTPKKTTQFCPGFSRAVSRNCFETTGTAIMVYDYVA